jgi:hypothetical protein
MTTSAAPLPAEYERWPSAALIRRIHTGELTPYDGDEGYFRVPGQTPAPIDPAEIARLAPLNGLPVRGFRKMLCFLMHSRAARMLGPRPK